MTKESASSMAHDDPAMTTDETRTIERQKVSKEEAVEVLKEMQENVGQISELAMEEKNLVKEFFNFLVQILKPFGEILEISVSALPESHNGLISKAHLHITGQLVLTYKNGEVEVLDLTDQKNREVLVEIIGEIMLKLKSVINAYRSKAEKRVQFLMLITKELQKVAKVFSEEQP